MKKIIAVLFFLIFFFPMSAKAVVIQTMNINGPTEVMTEGNITLSFDLGFDGLEKGTGRTLGIWVVGIEIVFDDEIFTISNVSTPDFNSQIYEENGKYYLFSEVIENSYSDKYCMHGQLYCSNYSAKITFSLNVDHVPQTGIKMGEIEVGLLDMVDATKEYTLTDVTSIEGTYDYIHLINIKKKEMLPEAPSSNEPTNISPIEKPVSPPIEKPIDKSVENKESTQKTQSVKSSNCFLSSLTVENYPFSFDKNIREYTIYVNEDVDSIKVIANTEASTSTYEITGTDSLNGNINEVIIEITAEDGSKSNYLINVIKKEVLNSNDIEENSNKKLQLNQTQSIILGIVGIIVVILIIIIFVIKKKKDIDIDRGLDKL